MKSKPATTERIDEMRALGLLKDYEIPDEVLSKKAQEIADEVDAEILRGLLEGIVPKVPGAK